MSIAVYTSLVGDYDNIHLNHALSDELDYFIFLDDTDREVQDGWTKLRQPFPVGQFSDARLSRIIKVKPYLSEELRRYDRAIYIDASLEIVDPNFYLEYLSYMETELLLSPHPWRKCAYEEIDAVKHIEPERSENQMYAYKGRGFPRNQGLYSCGLLGWDMNSSSAHEMSDLWLAHIERYSYLDQCSLPYCLWWKGIIPSVLPKPFWNVGEVKGFDWFNCKSHKVT